MDAETESLFQQTNATGSWFRARKTKPIWTRPVAEPMTIETIEGAQQVPAGAVLCRGEAGDLWPQSAEQLAAKYDRTGVRDENGWEKWVPRPGAAEVWAAEIPHAFHVQSEWGRFSGKPGDLLVKRVEGPPDLPPRDAWIVDRTLFWATYERVE